MMGIQKRTKQQYGKADMLKVIYVFDFSLLLFPV